MDKFLRFLFFCSLSLILIALGWYVEYSISEDWFSRVYSTLSVTVFILLVFSSSFLAFGTGSFVYNSKPLIRGVLIFCLLFFSGSHLFRAELPRVNDFLELTSYRYRYEVLPSLTRSTKELIGLTERRSRAIKKTVEDEIIVDFYRNFDKSILVKFPQHHAFITNNFSTEGPAVYSLVDTDFDLFFRPFAFADSKTIVSYNETMEVQGDGRQHLALSTLNKLKSEYTTQWKINLNTPIHHWGDVHDGKIYVPGRKFVSLPNEISRAFNHSSYPQCKESSSFNETIEIFSLNDGTLLKSIEILPILSKFPNGLYARFLNDCEDPIHINDVQIVKSIHLEKGFFPEWNIGDMLISMRNINSIALIDKDSYELKWISSLFAEQHSPRMTNYGTILVFDNRASNKEYGMSRITELDVATKEIVGIWEGTKGFRFESNQLGRLQLLDNRIFIQESDAGRLIELVCSERPISFACNKQVIFDAPYSEMFIAEVFD